MLEIQIGFRRSNTSLYGLLAQGRKNNLSQPHHLNARKKNKTKKHLGENELPCQRLHSSHTWKKLKQCCSDIHSGSEAFLCLLLLSDVFFATGMGSVWVTGDSTVLFFILHVIDILQEPFHTAVLFAFHVDACYVNVVPDDTPASLSQGKGL